MKTLLLLLVALLLLAFESVVVMELGMTLTRVDVTMALVVFLALKASKVEGALGAFGIGYLLDVMSGHPTMLYPFLAVLVLLLVRAAAAVIDTHSRAAFAITTAAAAAGHGLLAFGFTSITALSGQGVSLRGMPLQVVLSAGFAFVVWPALKRLDFGQDRPEPGVLR